MPVSELTSFNFDQFEKLCENVQHLSDDLTEMMQRGILLIKHDLDAEYPFFQACIRADLELFFTNMTHHCYLDIVAWKGFDAYAKVNLLNGYVGNILITDLIHENGWQLDTPDYSLARDEDVVFFLVRSNKEMTLPDFLAEFYRGFYPNGVN
jgi:hypothetical protein